jgi:hypothetical protein
VAGHGLNGAVRCKRVLHHANLRRSWRARGASSAIFSESCDMRIVRSTERSCSSAIACTSIQSAIVSSKLASSASLSSSASCNACSRACSASSCSSVMASVACRGLVSCRRGILQVARSSSSNQCPGSLWRTSGDSGHLLLGKKRKKEEELSIEQRCSSRIRGDAPTLAGPIVEPCP